MRQNWSRIAASRQAGSESVDDDGRIYSFPDGCVDTKTLAACEANLGASQVSVPTRLSNGILPGTMTRRTSLPAMDNRFSSLVQFGFSGVLITRSIGQSPIHQTCLLTKGLSSGIEKER
ncbi:hypothetical protein VTN77DRAFT_822 [Rasamsonia byssochlamydoides]|uniref:uncharacterized protein n=1 Tax=Rasamsonia byssochlamydoides TaxID=89139 RepID=UPI003743DE6C